MVLELLSGETHLRTIYNVIKVTQDERGMVIVVNRVEGVVITNKFEFGKHYNRFKIMVD